MIDQKTAARHVESIRFAGLDFQPEPEGIKFLAKTLAKHAHSDQHAAAVIATWIEKWPKWPRPADLVQMCEIVADPTVTAQRATRENCQRCGGSGWIEVQGEFGLTACYPCSHGPETDADRRMGVRITPALRRHYAQEAVRGEERARQKQELTAAKSAVVGKWLGV
jgi:hypothetical protein